MSERSPLNQLGYISATESNVVNVVSLKTEIKTSWLREMYILFGAQR
jgi:hypothetical protein